MNGIPTAARMHSTTRRRCCVLGCRASLEDRLLITDSVAHYVGCHVFCEQFDRLMPMAAGPWCGLARVGVSPLSWRRLALVATVLRTLAAVDGGAAFSVLVFDGWDSAARMVA